MRDKGVNGQAKMQSRAWHIWQIDKSFMGLELIVPGVDLQELRLEREF